MIFSMVVFYAPTINALVLFWNEKLGFKPINSNQVSGGGIVHSYSVLGDLDDS